jgi:hypothetical protein
LLFFQQRRYLSLCHCQESDSAPRNNIFLSCMQKAEAGGQRAPPNSETRWLLLETAT